MQKLKRKLAQNSIFSALSDDELEAVVGLGVHKAYEKGETIAYYGDVWPYLILIEEGAIHGLKESVEGRSLIVIELNSGDLIWGMAFFEEDAPMPVMLQAKTDMQGWLWHRDWLLPFLWGNGRFSWEFSRFAVRRMRRASEIVEELAFQPVRGRLARLLLTHYGEAVDEFVARDLTLDQMAAHVGTKREMVCRLLYQFAAEGAIEISRTEFMIANREKLEVSAHEAKG
ncbi:MAG: Crp/Fnr family transcriptional regulator [Chloroflexi bacterium]|nr:Crp/Fnr family transcriptional regulator [Chloroflexota bacterium]